MKLSAQTRKRLKRRAKRRADRLGIPWYNVYEEEIKRHINRKRER